MNERPQPFSHVIQLAHILDSSLNCAFFRGGEGGKENNIALRMDELVDTLGQRL